MQHLFTNIKLKQKSPSVDYNSKLMLIGSCFTENIGNQLAYYKFQTQLNPYGIIFHPNAILNIVERIVGQKEFTEPDLFFQNEQWNSYEVHSSLSHQNKETCLIGLNTILKQSFEKLSNATHLIITLGSAWGYILKEKNTLVANCHKVPQHFFEKKLSSAFDIEKTLNQIITLVKGINKNITIIFTVSPVRHIKDGIIENNVSKAHLIASLYNVIKKTEGTAYFPAYEIMMDTLRDYRFYSSDLLHPNSAAIDYIWDQFMNAWIYDKKSLETMKIIKEVQQGLAHKPFNPESQSHQRFLKKIDQKKQILTEKYPFIKF